MTFGGNRRFRLVNVPVNTPVNVPVNTPVNVSVNPPVNEFTV